MRGASDGGRTGRPMNGRPVAVNPYPKKPGITRYSKLRTQMARGVAEARERLRQQAQKKFMRGWPVLTIAKRFGMEEADIRLLLRTEADNRPRLVKSPAAR